MALLTAENVVEWCRFLESLKLVDVHRLWGKSLLHIVPIDAVAGVEENVQRLVCILLFSRVERSTPVATELHSQRSEGATLAARRCCQQCQVVVKEAQRAFCMVVAGSEVVAMALSPCSHKVYLRQDSEDSVAPACVANILEGSPRAVSVVWDGLWKMEELRACRDNQFRRW